MKGDFMKKNLFFIGLLVISIIAFAAFVPSLQEQKSTPEGDTDITIISSEPDMSDSQASAEAKLWPKDDSSLGFSSTGVIASMNIKVGDKVTKGDVLAELKGTEKYRLEISQASVDLLEAQDELKSLNDSAPKDKAEAEAVLVEAKKSLDEMNKAYQEFDTVDYRKKIDDANKAYKDKYSDVEDAKDLLDDVSELDAGSERRRTVEDDYKKVLQDYNDLERTYTTLVNDKDQSYADTVKAQAAVDDAQREVNELADGPKQTKLDIANQKIQTAKDKQESAQKSIELMQIIAPFDGEIVSVDYVAGELVNAEIPVIVMLDPSEKVLKTVDLSETDMTSIHLGGNVTVVFDAYPDTELRGTVTKITNWAEKYLGDVVYPVEITLENTNLPVLWGMTATIYF